MLQTDKLTLTDCQTFSFVAFKAEKEKLKCYDTVLEMGNFTHSIGGIFVLQYLSQKCIKWDNQGQFQKVQNLRSSKLSLVVQFDTVLAEI